MKCLLPHEAPKKNNTPLIIGIVVVVLLCCCCVVVDWRLVVMATTIMQSLGITN